MAGALRPDGFCLLLWAQPLAYRVSWTCVPVREAFWSPCSPLSRALRQPCGTPGWDRSLGGRGHGPLTSDLRHEMQHSLRELWGLVLASS